MLSLGSDIKRRVVSGSGCAEGRRDWEDVELGWMI